VSHAPERRAPWPRAAPAPATPAHTRRPTDRPDPPNPTPRQATPSSCSATPPAARSRWCTSAPPAATACSSPSARAPRRSPRAGLKHGHARPRRPRRPPRGDSARRRQRPAARFSWRARAAARPGRRRPLLFPSGDDERRRRPAAPPARLRVHAPPPFPAAAARARTPARRAGNETPHALRPAQRCPHPAARPLSLPPALQPLPSRTCRLRPIPCKAPAPLQGPPAHYRRRRPRARVRVTGAHWCVCGWHSSGAALQCRSRPAGRLGARHARGPARAPTAPAPARRPAAPGTVRRAGIAFWGPHEAAGNGGHPDWGPGVGECLRVITPRPPGRPARPRSPVMRPLHRL
jgi:hypothetical protein